MFLARLDNAIVVSFDKGVREYTLNDLYLENSIEEVDFSNLSIQNFLLSFFFSVLVENQSLMVFVIFWNDYVSFACLDEVLSSMLEC